MRSIPAVVAAGLAVELAVDHATTLEAPRGSTRTQVVAAKLLNELDLTANAAISPLDVDFAADTPGGACSLIQKELSCVAMMVTSYAAQALHLRRAAAVAISVTATKP